MLEVTVGGINCPRCAKKNECLMLSDSHVIWYNEGRMDGQLQTIVVDQSSFLEPQFGKPLKTYPVKLDRVSGKKKNIYDYKISCPLCGEFTMEEYKGIPKEVDVYVGADRGEKYAIYDFILDSGQSKSDQAATEIMKKDIINGSE